MTRPITFFASAAVLMAAFGAPAFSQGVPQAVSLTKVDPSSLATGYRVSKVVGSTVVNAANETVGTISDLIVTANSNVPSAVLSVGGFLGMGTKYVIVPYSTLVVHEKQMVFRDATKDSVKALPDLSSLTTGDRTSKIIGASVVNGANETVGTVDDLIVTPNEKVPFAVLSVGGFLGMGAKYVVVAYSTLEVNDKQLKIQKASKEALEKLPSFTYSK
ncbi:MAG: PRC-barrel domain-containing protein [Rhodospirillaceae bacterium]